MTEREIKPKKKRKIFQTLNKKQKIGLGITSIIALAAVFSGVYFFFELQEKSEFIFKCGLADGPDSIDPLKNPVPTYENLIILDQIAEGLFAYDQNNTDTPIVPNLALNGNWSSDNLNFTCDLRRDVTFHDGTPFKATAVQWTFERIYRFIETMPYDQIWAWESAYLNSEREPIINRTEIIDDYTVKFVLNQPYVPIRELLALWNSYILSPTSTPEDDFIDIRTGRLVGTGPFIFDSCDVNYWGESSETHMHANPDYWGGVPSINKLVFLDLGVSERMERMLSGELSYIWGNRDNNTLDDFKLNPEFTVVPIKMMSLWYFGMNNKIINLTMRKAISYAFNYNHYLKEVWGGHAERAKSPLAKQMQYSNWEDFNVPYYNITRARQILLNANWPGTDGLTANDNISTGNEWEILANSPSPLKTYNFSVCNLFMELAANLAIEDLKQIGLKVNLTSMGSLVWEYKLNEGEFDIVTLGWGVVSNDPVDVINPLYSSKLDGIGNFWNFNDTQVQQWMEDALQEFNELTREQLYFDIQQRLVEELIPVVCLANPIRYDIWDSDVKGIPTDGAPLRFILKFVYIDD
ncbi:MAG: ABC transporter substrate-binding protein [Promethearchaeota archaeon]